MKTWQRILVVIIVVAFGSVVGFDRLIGRDKAFNAISVSNLKVVGLGLMMYSDDYNNVLPNLSDAESMKIAVAAYVSKDESRAEKFFVHPKTGRPYQPNSSLTYKERTGFNAPSAIAVVYEDAPAADATRAVLFGDGHVERVTESRWLELKKSSNIL